MTDGASALTTVLNDGILELFTTADGAVVLIAVHNVDAATQVVVETRVMNGVDALPDGESDANVGWN